MRKNQKQNMNISMSNTPRSKAVQDLVQAGINPQRAEVLRRRLTFSYAINDEIKQTTLSRNKNAKKIVEVHFSCRESYIKKVQNDQYGNKGVKFEQKKISRCNR